MLELQKAPWEEWDIVKRLGRGSFGTVYEIHRKLIDDDTETAALKVISIPQNDEDIEELYSEGYDEESITATFRSYLKNIVTEYSLMRKVDGSAHIVSCKDIRYVQHDDGIGWDIFIRMELLTPLLKALPADVAEDTVIQIGKDICNALVLCKKYDIVHRDIKPQNIFISPNGDYKLGDFGIAKTVEKTMGGTKIGTYKYMAPEVYNNQPYGSAADIYSLGLVLYWLLNERRMPFMPLPPAKLSAGQDEQARLRRLSGEPLPAPIHGSSALKQIVLKACAYDPKDRYKSAAEMKTALLEIRKTSEAVPSISSINNKSVQIDNLESPEEDITVGVWSTYQKEQNTTAHIAGEISSTIDITPPSDDAKTNEKQGVAVNMIGIPTANEKTINLGNTEELTSQKNPFVETPKKQNKSKGKTGLIVCFVACLALALICCMILPKFSKNETTPDVQLQSTEKNTTTTEDTTIFDFTETTTNATQPAPKIVEISGGHNGVVCHWSDNTTTCARDWGTALADLCLHSAIDDTVFKEVLEGQTFAAGIKADGTVIVEGNEELKASTATWTDIVDLQCGLWTESVDNYDPQEHIVGLRNDGTVCAAGDNTWGQCNVDDWSDIVEIYSQGEFTIGLRKDGTVLHAGYCEYFDWSGWTNVSDITGRWSYFVVGLRHDGTVVTTDDRYNVQGWENVVQIAAGKCFVAGLRADGTVVISEDAQSSAGEIDVTTWTDVVSIAAGGQHLLGLRADGTVLASGLNNAGQCDVGSWKNVTQIVGGGYYSCALCEDGTLLIS